MVRIPITIKIPVNDAGRPSGLAVAKVAIKDISTGLENVTVRALGLKRPPRQLQKIRSVEHRELNGQYMATRFPVVSRPSQQAAATRTMPRYSVKTINITLTWPTLPSLAEAVRRLLRLHKKVWLSLGICVLAIAALFVGIHFFHGSGQTPPASTTDTPQLVRGTPDYATVLPTGKSIQQLGGWTRISPPNRSPVYTYVDKIGNTQINVSEQPLPIAFQRDTANKIEQMAESYNATDKFTAAGNTAVYVGSSGAGGEQSAIFTKSKLLVLIKSAAPISNNQWTAYISSLR